MDQTSIILKPVITERSLKDAASGNYTFLVAGVANKNAIKSAIEKQFIVNVIQITTTTRKGTTTRVTRLGKKVSPFRIKKARVKLKKDQKISLFEEGDKKQ